MKAYICVIRLNKTSLWNRSWRRERLVTEDTGRPAIETFENKLRLRGKRNDVARIRCIEDSDGCIEFEPRKAPPIFKKSLLDRLAAKSY
jgi:hypothetical protein